MLLVELHHISRQQVHNRFKAPNSRILHDCNTHTQTHSQVEAAAGDFKFKSDLSSIGLFGGLMPCLPRDSLGLEDREPVGQTAESRGRRRPPAAEEVAAGGHKKGRDTERRHPRRLRDSVRR